MQYYRVQILDKIPRSLASFAPGVSSPMPFKHAVPRSSIRSSSVEESKR